MIELSFSSDPIDLLKNETAITLAFEDIRPLKGQAGLVDWRLNGKLSQLILAERFAGNLGDALLMPAGGRLAAKELMLVGLGNRQLLTENKIPQVLELIVNRILRKKSTSFSIRLSDLVPDMFEWRNCVRRFISLISGHPEEYKITLTEPDAYIADAKKRHMDFAYDVNVSYS